jgi:sulfonate transport system substrate-binding protein
MALGREDAMRLYKIILATIAALALGGGSAGAEPLKVRIAWVVPVGNWASIIYEKKDLMKHYGKSYEVEPVHFQGTPQMMQALAAGELEIADLAYSTFAIAIENAGMSDLRVLGDEAQDGVNNYTGKYYVLKDGPVKTIEDLKGKTLATVGVGAALDIPVRAMLRKHGLEDRRDYQMVETAFPNMLPMLLEHKVDFITSVNPFSRDPRFQEQTRVLFTVKEAMDGPTQFIIWTARKAFLDKNHAAMVDLMEDAVRVTRFLTDPANHAAVVQIAAKITKQPPERLDYVYTKDDNYRDPMMRPNMANLQRAIDVQQQTGFLKTKLDVKQYADLDILKEAIARIK